MTNFKNRGGLALLMNVFLLATLLSGCTPTRPKVSPSAMHTIIDMAGQKVTLPLKINRVATVGPVPVLNGFIFAFGEQKKIVNGLPLFAKSKRWKYQTVFAPGIATEPSVQGANNDPNLEELLKVNPDVVFTMDQRSAETIRKSGIPAVYLSWTQPEDVKKVMKIVGQVFNKEAVAEDYIKYFDQTLNQVKGVVSQIPQAQRPKVLYCDVKTLTEPQLIAEWWIPAAGGISVTNNGRKAESISFSMEQVLKWNPDILIVTDPTEVKEVYHDPRFSRIKAIINKKVFAAPMGSSIWANRTIEQPLTVLWAAKTFYPQRFKNVNLDQTVKNFYAHFFKYRLSDQQVNEILSGNPQ
ncbi:ABC transporter periplasmic binding domain protein [Acididesulfobacillus acetoxydans]|uniref:ABC transporter periplasmic binding domain protein n=1 Tax=Acididesulfobacillus acetoxydans TaxID=1561005 RepID=A0A8S0XV21_9FIRM|nr:ABC transporter substrate-binding protein [Acididesulfobacillus acetoxydans]CAA7599947.1 ABC transporter periplasmic binding domain protein [Acididesulfobacillus acetoxydans]CEJ07961.1 Periplasmic binding protein [Acididesulfobacillus acetoxydans]